MGINWTPEIHNRCVELWDSGKSGSECAAELWNEFRVNMSRNAVAGRMHRCGKTKPERATRKATPRKIQTRLYKKRKPAALPLFDDANSPPSLQIPITETSAYHCRFIAGDDRLCCGHPTIEGTSWCPAHAAIVWSKHEKTRNAA